ncbi:MAG: hypothetical protein KGD58_08070 [Candidatus Lokiarchaeota archaeon]|nr:hypothetical protein [Candidatus Lokiarchaeota archaeon]
MIQTSRGFTILVLKASNDLCLKCSFYPPYDRVIAITAKPSTTETTIITVMTPRSIGSRGVSSSA